MGEQLGVSRPFVGEYESGERRLDVIELRPWEPHWPGVVKTWEQPHHVRGLQDPILL
ncbi:hypothetical protein [Mycobacteroides chelonae]|uniref:hypothetical protein n=1 Tax=Mycobacteroides chelonae TaxID=1774 RepID=UPI001F3B3F2E|nr:hypothetical protein [Mycobacteroides chelonae]